ncbi:hypothetical protein CPB85DRAFT_82052 [Mucidula mucida]|nr:hypothetical protein CPB85DRAFT_82052 [Mucidula mucida]
MFVGVCQCVVVVISRIVLTSVSRRAWVALHCSIDKCQSLENSEAFSWDPSCFLYTSNLKSHVRHNACLSHSFSSTHHHDLSFLPHGPYSSKSHTPALCFTVLPSDSRTGRAPVLRLQPLYLIIILTLRWLSRNTPRGCAVEEWRKMAALKPRQRW